jgi:hypothetical protein
MKILESEASMNRLIRDLDSIAYLTPGRPGYTALRTNHIPITVSLEDVREYANGSRVALDIGNTSTANITGLSATIEWGEVKDGSPVNETAHRREVKFTETIRSGRWTRVTVSLDGVPPKNLGFVRLREVSHDSISLPRP